MADFALSTQKSFPKCLGVWNCPIFDRTPWTNLLVVQRARMTCMIDIFHWANVSAGNPTNFCPCVAFPLKYHQFRLIIFNNFQVYLHGWGRTFRCTVSTPAGQWKFRWKWKYYWHITPLSTWQQWPHGILLSMLTGFLGHPLGHELCGWIEPPVDSLWAVLWWS